jgi:hypothetical protein
MKFLILSLRELKHELSSTLKCDETLFLIHTSDIPFKDVDCNASFIQSAKRDVVFGPRN